MIIHGDCLEEMRKMESGVFDITITSPPYNLGKDHHTGSKRHNPYKDDIPEEEYEKNQIDVLNEIYRVTNEGGSLFYNHKNRIKNGISTTPYQWILKTKWIIKQELVWINRSQNFDKIRFYPFTERIYWLVKSPKTKLVNTINHSDVFNWKPVGTRGNHTRAFPEKMVEDILSCFPGCKTIFDPYSGSGTVGVVAFRMNKEFIGIEREEEYIKIAEARIKALIKQYLDEQSKK